MINRPEGNVLKNIVMLKALIGLSVVTAVSLFVLSLYMDWTVPHEELFSVFTHVAEKRFQTAEDIRLYSGILGTIACMIVYVDMKIIKIVK